MKKYIVLLVFAFICVVSFSQQRYQATVYLKNGNIIPGVIIEKLPDESIKLKIDDTHILLIQKDEILKMTEEPIQESSDSTHSKFDISAGIGFPELMNIGIKYQVFDQLQIGLSIGGIYFPGIGAVTFSGDIYYHFGGLSKFSEIQPWYGRIGITSYGVADDGEYMWFSYLRIGHELYFSGNFGISLDAGIGLAFDKYVESYTSSNTPIFKSTISFVRVIGVSLFYRF
jgi:hypothetical protein